MQEWTDQIIKSQNFGIIFLIASFLLGVLSAMLSCCNVAALGAVAGYAGTKETRKKSDLY